MVCIADKKSGLAADGKEVDVDAAVKEHVYLGCLTQKQLIDKLCEARKYIVLNKLGVAFLSLGAALAVTNTEADEYLHKMIGDAAVTLAGKNFAAAVSAISCAIDIVVGDS